MRKFQRFAQLKRTRTAALAAIALLLFTVATPLSAAASDRWFHVRVIDEGSGGAEVNVNLPLSLIEMAFEMIPEELSAEVSNEVQVELNDAGFDISRLRDLWNEIRDGQDATYLTVDSEDAQVAVRKEGDFLVAETVEMRGGGAEVDIRFPLQVVDALFSGPDNTLDFAAAIRALGDYGDGDMVTIRDNDDSTTVRIWVDSSNEGR